MAFTDRTTIIGITRPATAGVTISSLSLSRVRITVLREGRWIQLLVGVDNRRMRLAHPEPPEQVGLGLYERKALMALMLCGVADAATLCREGGVPTSKIYLAMEKLAGLGLVQVQPTRPKMFAALPSEVVVGRIVDIVRERSDRFAAQAS